MGIDLRVGGRKELTIVTTEASRPLPAWTLSVHFLPKSLALSQPRHIGAPIVERHQDLFHPNRLSISSANQGWRLISVGISPPSTNITIWSSMCGCEYIQRA